MRSTEWQDAPPFLLSTPYDPRDAQFCADARRKREATPGIVRVTLEHYRTSFASLPEPTVDADPADEDERADARHRRPNAGDHEED